MMDFKRYLEKQIVDDALHANKIAFISGPRQVGKTTLTQSILKNLNQVDNYYNYDDQDFRKIWMKDPKNYFKNNDKKSVIVLDEIHKDRLWKNKLKGLYDTLKNDYKFIVTGSAKLDFYRKSGDSLQGRYLPYQLHPVSLGEEAYIKPPPEIDWDENFSEKVKLNDLLTLGGFPEPLFQMSAQKASRWRKLYKERLIKEDLRDLHQFKDIQLIDNLALLIEERAGSQLSYQSLQEDLSVSFDSVRRWIDALEGLFFCYRIKPYSKNIKYSIKKEPKIFLYDWSAVQDEGHKFENLIAGHLLKSCHAWTQAAFDDFELYYVRDKQKREVDFLILRNKKPYALIEVKSSQSRPTDALIHYEKLLKPNFCLQVVKDEKKERTKSIQHPNIRVISARKFLGALV